MLHICVHISMKRLGTNLIIIYILGSILTELFLLKHIISQSFISLVAHMYHFQFLIHMHILIKEWRLVGWSNQSSFRTAWTNNHTGSCRHPPALEQVHAKGTPVAQQFHAECKISQKGYSDLMNIFLSRWITLLYLRSLFQPK